MSTTVSDERARAFLAEGDLELLGRIPWASNATLLARVRHRELEGLAVYKPVRGERPLWDFPAGTLYRREVAAYLVSEQLGWRVVPPTLVREGPLGVGSLQLYVDADAEITAFELLAAGNAALPRIAAFDVVTNNADRKAGHCLLGEDERVWAIDHGVCFHAEPKLRTVLWDLAGHPLEAADVADLEALAGEAAGGGLRGRLAGLLATEEVAAVAERALALARAGRLPAPGSGRAYPWPLV
ncbi:MAG TPA: SCO1664 family protein [Actinomycetota bacterium]|nr:SCO1664 family protein [Actinomycetota bacterium]